MDDEHSERQGVGTAPQPHGSRRNGAEGHSGQRSVQGGAGQLLMAMTHMKEEIIQAFTLKMAAQEEKIMRKIDVIAGGISTRLSGLGDERGESARDVSRQSDKVARRKPVLRPTAEKVKECVKEDRGVIPLLQWTALITVMSFASTMRNARAWIPDDVYAKVTGEIGVMKSSSGLSGIMFSVQAGEKKDKMRTTAGRLWSLILRNATGTVIGYARSTVFRTRPSIVVDEVRSDGASEGNCAPQWLAKLGSPQKTAEVVRQAFDKFETTEETYTREFGGDGRSRTKKRKLNGEDLDFEVCAVAIKNIRQILMKSLTYGRTEARAVLYESLLFIVEKIADYDTIEDAADEGV